MTNARGLRALANLGRRMREAQRSYSQQRTEGWLREAEGREREFDRAVDRILADSGQQSLAFGEGGES